MKWLKFVLLATVLVAASYTSASAGMVTRLKYTGAGVTADLWLTTTTITSGPFTGIELVTGVTGTRNGQPVTSFVSAPDMTGDAFIYKDAVVDNQVFCTPVNIVFTTGGNSGFVYGTVQGEFNPFSYFGGGYHEYVLGSGVIPGNAIEVSVSCVPEPATLVSASLAGLIGLAVAVRHRRAQAA